MRLSDVNEDYLQEAPAGLLKRASTKLKKQAPFAPGVRARAEGEDITDKAANQLALALHQWAGRTKKPKNKLTPKDLLKFFHQEGYAKTAKKVISKAAEEKGVENVFGGKKQKKDKSTEKGDTEKEQEQEKASANSYGDEKEPSKEEIAQAYSEYFSDLKSESFKARLDRMLTEDDEDESITFNMEEVEDIILKTVAKVAEGNPEGLEKIVNQGEEGPQNSYSKRDRDVRDDVGGIDPDTVQKSFKNLTQDLTKTIDNSKDLDSETKKKLKKTLQKRISQAQSELKS